MFPAITDTCWLTMPKLDPAEVSMDDEWKTTDEQLIAAYRQGELTFYDPLKPYQLSDLTAFPRLMDRYQPKLFALLVWLRYPRDDIDDFLQVLWTSQWKAIQDGKYDPSKGRFGPYLMSSLGNLLRDMGRRRLAWPLLTETDLMAGDDPTGSPVENAADRAPSPAAEFLACVLGSVLSEFYAELPADEQELLRQRYLEQLTYNQLAGELRVVISTAQKRTERILAALRERLGREMGDSTDGGPGPLLAEVALADGCERLVLAWLFPETCVDRLSLFVGELQEFCLPQDGPDRLALAEALLEGALRQLEVFSAEQSGDRRDVCPSAERANGHKSRLVEHALAGLRENSGTSQGSGRRAPIHDLERMCDVLSDLLERLSKLA